MTNEFQKEIEQEQNLLEENEFSIYIEDTYDARIAIVIDKKEVEIKFRFWFDQDKIDECFPGGIISVIMNNIYTILGKQVIEIDSEINMHKPITNDILYNILRSHAIDLLKYKFINAIQVTKLYHGENVGFILYKNWP